MSMDINIMESRSNFEKLGNRYTAADNTRIEKEIIQDVPCYWFDKVNAKPPGNLILYLHGGCYVLGSIDSHKALVSHFANETGITILFIEYSLSPENPFPVAINEVLKVYNYLVDELQVPNLSFMGDSAGAGLVMSVVSILNTEKNSNNLRQIIMISPWVDLRNNSNSVRSNKNIDPVLTKEGLDFFASLYTRKNKLSAINPIETLFGVFPPTLILVGSNEILLDDSRMILSKIAARQPLTKLTIYENQAHVWLMDDIHSEPSKKALQEIKSFMNVH
jgi:monoterpene epsilon-lactone hydrolase